MSKEYISPREELEDELLEIAKNKQKNEKSKRGEEYEIVTKCHELKLKADRLQKNLRVKIANYFDFDGKL